MEQNKIDQRLIEAADNYVGHPYEIDEDLSVFSNRRAFIAGARWMLNNPTGGELLYVNQKSFKLGYKEGLKAKESK